MTTDLVMLTASAMLTWFLVMGKGIAMWAHAPIGVIIPGCDPVQPDFLLVRMERSEIYTDDNRIRDVPDLLAEILSPSNPAHDVQTKRAAYARAGVPEYWIVRPETRDVIVLSNPNASASDFAVERLFTTDEYLVSPTLPIRVAVAVLFDLLPGAKPRSTTA